ncbi:MAG: RHS repeat-associated core domain-containing protein [Phycisphaerales bacterium]|nr:RHS repeat-associated core domain-containing protein [Phycisphaerales bacterium]
MQHRNRTDNANAARDPSRGNALVGPPDLAIFSSSYGYCEGDPEFDERANLVTGDDPECIDVADQSAFMSLFGLSSASVMRAELLWDAENRLAAYIPLNSWSGAGVPARSRLGASKVTFKYDYRGRRIEKNVDAWNSGAWYGDAYPTERRRFIWSGAGVPARGRLAGVPAGGWLMLRETIETDSASDGTFEATRVKTYTWGKDLGGGAGILPATIESAGGIGGLLAVYDDSATSGSTGDDLAYVYMYDANGNVGQVCDLSQSTASASIVAKYEYDAYGNAPVSSGAYAVANTYRFSTKPWDDETGLGYWGYRYYDARLGRWMSRDPIGEAGGICLYAFGTNSPITRHDSLGLLSLIAQDTSQPSSKPGACSPTACTRPERTYAGCVGGKCRAILGPKEHELPLGPARACVIEHEQVHCRQFEADGLTCDGVGDFCTPRDPTDPSDKGGQPAPRPYRPTTQPADSQPRDPEPIARECEAYQEQLKCLERRGERECRGNDSCITTYRRSVCRVKCNIAFHCIGDDYDTNQDWGDAGKYRDCLKACNEKFNIDR